MTPGPKIKRKFRNTPGHSHYYTTSTDHRRPHLKDDRICQALADGINKAANKHNFVILAFVFMPDHIHLLIHPLDEIYSMESIAKSIKLGVSKMAKARKWIDTDLWEEGGGYDRNIFSPKAREPAVQYIHRNPIVKGMVESSVDYFWSSANWYHSGDDGPVKCRFISSLDE